MATHHNLKAIAAFRALRGVVIGSAGVAISGQTEESLVAKAEHLLADIDIAHSIMGVLRVLDMPNEQVIGHLVIVCLVWAMLLFVQAYGLWKERYWAVWLALATSVFVLGGFAWVALPIFGTTATFIVAGNLLVALYLLYLLRRKYRIAE